MFNDNNGLFMPVAPAYSSGGSGGSFFGGDGIWAIIVLALLFNNGFGFGGFGGFGNGFGMGMVDGGWGLYPWLNNSEHISDGFRDQQLSTQVGNIQNAITSGFGDVQLGIAGVNQNICQTGNAVVGAVTGAQNALAQQMYANQISDLERSFSAQTAQTAGMNNIAMNLQNCCCENRANIADLKYTVATENCADRTAAYQNTRDIIDSQVNGTRAILDKLCQLELDGVKAQVDAKNDRINELQTQLNMASLRESQTAQNAFISQGFANEVDALYNRLNTCPIPTTPVFGRTQIFTCNQNQGCGCSGNTFYN